MNERNEYQPGDRIQMVSCKDPYAPILPGEKGTISHIDDLGTLHMHWDSGRTLGVCLEEDEVRKIPINQEWELLNTLPIMQCDEAQFDTHNEEIASFFGIIEDRAAELGSEWVVKSSFIDPANNGKAPTFEFVGESSLDNLLQACDVKQGIDVAFAAKRPPREQSLLLIAYGQGYTMPNGTFSVVTQVLECKLVSPAVAKDFHERMDAGWNARGEAATRLFGSARDHENLSSALRECKAINRDKSRDTNLER